MNQRYIGFSIIAVAILLAVFVYSANQRTEESIQLFMAETGSCFLEDGTCLHEEAQPTNIFGWALAGALLLFGLYLAFFDRTQEVLAKHQVKVSEALAQASKSEKERDEFKAYVAAFDDDEQKILKAVREQDGIKQSTLRYRTGLSKTGLSLLLKSLENRKVISRKQAGKTKEVYLVKKF